MGGGDWKDSGYRRLLGRTEDLRTSHTQRLQELGGFPLTLCKCFLCCCVFQRLRNGQGAQPRDIQKYKNNTHKGGLLLLAKMRSNNSTMAVSCRIFE